MDSTTQPTLPDSTIPRYPPPRKKRTPANLATRMKAYELFSAGVKKSDIAREFGLTRAAITRWSKQDSWSDRRAEVVRHASSAADLVVGDQVSAVLIRLRNRLATRVDQLETLCVSDKPNVRLSAIMAWFKLAGITQAIPSPVQPDKAASLELIQDLIDEPLPKETGPRVGNHKLDS